MNALYEGIDKGISEARSNALEEAAKRCDAEAERWTKKAVDDVGRGGPHVYEQACVDEAIDLATQIRALKDKP